MRNEPYALVADPEPDLERRVRAELHEATSPLVVRAVSDGLAAHTVLAEHGAPAIMVANLSLPKRDGFALLRGLRRVDRARVVPAIALAAAPKMRELAELLRGELGPLVVEPTPLQRGVIRTVLQRGAAAAANSIRPPVMSFHHGDGERSARIQALGFADPTPPDPTLQATIARIAQEFAVPVALATVVLDDRQWFKSFYGLRGKLLADRGTSRDWSFCQHVVEGRSPLLVPDAREHPLFTNNPLVRDGSVVGYAGVPITLSNGDVLGSLCLVDQRPLEIDAADLGKLQRAAERLSVDLDAARR